MRHKTESAPHAEKYPPEFRRAIQVFLKAPQTKLIRYICATLNDDPGYAFRNRLSIMRVVEDILKTQGVDPKQAFDGVSVFRLIKESAIRLKIKTKADWYSQF